MNTHYTALTKPHTLTHMRKRDLKESMVELVTTTKRKGNGSVPTNKMMKYIMMAYNDQNDSRYPTTNQDSNVSTWRMSNFVNELENRCKSLKEENKRLGETVHKYKTEFEVETSYLKKQVTNEREKQLKWKELYYDARSELTDLKHQLLQYQQQQQQSANNNNNTQNPTSSSIVVASSNVTTVVNNNEITSDHNNNNNNTTTTTMVLHPPHIRRIPHPSMESGCKECENERKRTTSESEPNTMAALHRYPLTMGSSPLLSSPKDNRHHSDSHHLSMFPSPSGHQASFVHTSKSTLTSPKGVSEKRSSSSVNLYYECRVCGRGYDTEQKLHFHAQVHAPVAVRTRPSSIGDYSPADVPLSSLSATTTSTAAGMLGSSPVDYLACTECPEKFRNDDDYRRHLLVHMFKCRYCGIVLDSETKFTLHMKTHADAPPMSPPIYVCYMCDKQLSSVQQLTRHLLSHPDELNFTCVECGKCFQRKSQLVHHAVVHSSRPFTCKECHKTFAHKTHLRRHEVVHSGLRPHQCRVCHQSFSRKSSLSRHYFIHTTEKPFVCPVCDKGFNRKGRLKNHLNIHIREGFSQLVDYVIERRPITREFIEQMNQVKSGDEGAGGDGYTTMSDLHYPQNQRAPSFVVKSEPHDYELIKEAHHHSSSRIHSYVKDESEESSCSETDEGDIDENEADMSEEITFDNLPVSAAPSASAIMTTPTVVALTDNNEANELLVSAAVAEDSKGTKSHHLATARAPQQPKHDDGLSAFDQHHPVPHSREIVSPAERSTLLSARDSKQHH